MLIKQKCVFIVCLLILYPVAAYSKVSFKKLPVRGTGYGFVLNPNEDVTTIQARIDYGINNNSKISVAGGIGFADDDYLESYRGDVPPIPGVGVTALHIQPLEQSGLELFLQSSFSGAFARVVDNVSNDTIVNSRAYGLSGTGGILKRLSTQSDLVLIPYFALSYSNVWLTVESIPWDYEETVSERSFGGSVGLEIELSQKISMVGSLDFSFQSSDTAFSIGLNFH